MAVPRKNWGARAWLRVGIRLSPEQERQIRKLVAREIARTRAAGGPARATITGLVGAWVVERLSAEMRRRGDRLRT